MKYHKSNCILSCVNIWDSLRATQVRAIKDRARAVVDRLVLFT
jgi:hypothetical protein